MASRGTARRLRDARPRASTLGSVPPPFGVSLVGLPPGGLVYAPAMPLVQWLRVTRTCNNACRFCSESAALDGAPVSLEELESALDAIRVPLMLTPRDVEVRLAGGEPTASPHLPALIESVARRGFTPVLVTNGRALAKPGRVQHLVDRGLAGLRVSLHGATAATHDALVGAPGAFRQTVSALALAATTKARRCVSFVLTKDNASELPALFELAKRVSCDEVELRDVLPTEDRARFTSLRLPDDVARGTLSDAARRAERAKIHLRTIGFERLATNTRATALGPGAQWPLTSWPPAPPRTPQRLVILGASPRDPVIGRLKVGITEVVEHRRIPVVLASREEPLGLREGDLVLCTGFAEASELFEREPRAHQLDVRILDFHMLADFEAFRARWVTDMRAQSRERWWPSDRLVVISCFPGYAPLYDWYGVPRDALRPHPYTVDPSVFKLHPEPAGSPYAFSGGNHLRDIETLAAAGALRSASSVLPLHVYHGGPAGPPARGVVYRGSTDFWAFYETLAKSRFVVLPLSRDPTCAAGITVAAMAIAAGRPVVASATPAMRDHLDDGVNALLVEPEDPRALADAIDRLERDHELRARLEHGAREAARVTTAETFVDVLLGP